MGMKYTIKATKNPYKCFTFRKKTIKPDGPFLFRFKEENDTFEIPCYLICGFESRKFLIHVPECKLPNEITFCEHLYLAREKEDGVFSINGNSNDFLN